MEIYPLLNGKLTVNGIMNGIINSGILKLRVQ